MVGERRSLLIDDAAILLGVSRRTVYYRIRYGRLDTIRTRGGSQRVLLDSIERLLHSERSSRARAKRNLRTQREAEFLKPKPLSLQVQPFP